MYYKHHSEYQNIKRSMIVLSLSLILVYIVLFYVKWDLWKSTIDSSIAADTNSEIKISEINNWNINIESSGLNIKDINLQSALDQGIWDNNELSQNSLKQDVDQDEKHTGDGNIESNEDWNDLFVLSGTKTYYGELDFVEKLWISYKYALKDDKNIYYLNMWDYDYDFSDIARKLKWSLYVMNTAQELIANGMFGEKVTYINIPEYEKNRVLILLEVNNQSWLLAIDYAIYHQVKPYLKTLFID